MAVRLPSTMRAVRLHPSSSDTSFSATNPAPSSSLMLDSDVSLPHQSSSSELLVRIHATTMVRGCLEWPESYAELKKILGWDFAGTVVAPHTDAIGEQKFKDGDRVYGMASAERAGTWAEYAVVSSEECTVMPEGLDFGEAASVPMSGLTAWQALFHHATVTIPSFGPATEAPVPNVQKHKILITGASGCVGIFIVQLARLAGLHVVAASRSNARNEDFLKQLGADEVVEYDQLDGNSGQFDIVIDSVGGKVLEKCWSLITAEGKLVSIESNSWDFVAEHKKAGLSNGKDGVKALFFIVSPSHKDMEGLSDLLKSRLLKLFVARTMTLAETAEAYNAPASNSERGKVVLLP